MALTEEQIKRLDKLDFSLGGGFADFMENENKWNVSKDKFLFVGLGGKGSQTVAKLKTEICKQLICDKETRKPKNVEYLAIDSSIDDLEKLCKKSFGQVGLSVDPTNPEVCQLYSPDAAAKLEQKDKLPDYITSWLNPNMNKQLVGEGAGGIRQAGRYLLFSSAFATVTNALKNKLNNLHEQITNVTKERLVIYIFAGVGGGTGSGTIIDIPYIIRKICETWSNVRLYGYIFLPDTYPDGVNYPYVKYNAYAALKEINTFMKIGEMQGEACFEAQYTYASEWKIKSNKPIFDSCVLISGLNVVEGQRTNSDKYAFKVAIDSIINQISDPETPADYQVVSSFLDNNKQMIAGRVNALKVPKDMYYQFNVIGVGGITLPTEEIMAYISHGTFDLLRKGWDKHASQQDVERLLSMIHMLPQEQAQNIVSKSKVSMMEYHEGIGGRTDKGDVQDNSLYNVLKNIWMSNNVLLYDAWDEAKNKNMSESIIKELDAAYKSAFVDEGKGIYFLRELLASRIVDGSAFNGLLFRIENEYKSSISGLIRGQEEIQAQTDERMKEIQTELDSAFCVFPKRKIEEYKSLCIQKFTADNMIYMYEKIIKDCMEQIIAWIKEKIGELQNYVDVFTKLNDIIERNYLYVMSEDKVSENGYITLLELKDAKTDSGVQQVIQYMDSLLAEKRAEGMVTALEQKILDTKEAWKASEEDFDPMDVFVRYIEEQYSPLAQLTLESFLSIKYKNADINANITALGDSLSARAEVAFPERTSFPMNELPQRKYVFIPAGAGVLSKALQGVAQNKGDANNPVKTIACRDRSHVYWYNLAAGVPIFALKELENYEEIYESEAGDGCQLKETVQENWKDFPALSAQAWWPTANFNPRERELAEKVKKETDEFIRSGLLTTNTLGQYVAHCLPIDNSVQSNYIEGRILDWCKNTYLKDPLKDTEGFYDTGKNFFEVIASTQNFIDYQAAISYVNETDIYKLIRMNVFLYRRLLKTYEIYQKCCRILENAQAVLRKKLKLKNNMKRLYDYARTGIIRFNPENLVLVNREGYETELLYFDDYTAWDNQFYIYQAVLNLQDKIAGDFITDMDTDLQALLNDHSAEARQKYTELSNKFMDECTKALSLLKQAKVQREFGQLGRNEDIKIYTQFYNDMLALRVGR